MSGSFVHHLRIDQVRDGDRIDLAADEAERQSIADRLGIAKIDRLEAHAALTRTGELIRAKGRLTAALDQSCVVTGDPVAAHIDEPFELMFMPPPPAAAPDEEIELGESDCDVVFYEGGVIDLGSAIGDTLALSLDPYPRSASAELALKEAGIMTEEQASPFAILAQLKGRESSSS